MNQVTYMGVSLMQCMGEGIGCSAGEGGAPDRGVLEGTNVGGPCSP